MKTNKLFLGILVSASVIISSCEKNYEVIEGYGPVVTQTLQIDNFSGIDLTGVDDVYISYGEEQSVVVKAQANIISRIKTDVRNGIWKMELENGRYRDYELTYYLTLPDLDKVYSTGTGNVIINSFPARESLYVNLEGTGSFLGFPMETKSCEVIITGTGRCEVNVRDLLDVTITGTGKVYYQGSPHVKTNISGTGSVGPAIP